MPEGKEIGRVTIRVLPDTEYFRSKLKSELESIGDDLKIPVTADTAGLKADVAAAVKAAEAGQKVDIPVDIDNKGVAAAVAKAVDVKPPKIPVDIDAGNVQREIDVASASAKVTPELDVRDFNARMQELLKPVELPVKPDLADRAIQRELDRLYRLEVPMAVDTTGFSREALQARADAAKLLEKEQLKLRLDAQDDDLRQKLARSRAELKELNELGVSPKYDANALRQAQGDLQRYILKLDELQKKKTYTTDQEGQLAKLKIDLEYAQLEADRLGKSMAAFAANPMNDRNSKYASDLAKSFSDAQFKAVGLEKKIRDIRESKIDPKVDLDIADLLRKIDTVEGRIRDMTAMGGEIQFRADVDSAVANIRKLESERARVSAQVSKLDFELDTASLENARNIMRETSDNEVRLLSNSLAGAKTQMIELGNQAGPTGTKIMKLGRDTGPTGTQILQLGNDTEETGRKFNIGSRAAEFFHGILGRIGTRAAALGNRIQAIQALVGQVVSTFLTLPTAAFALSVAGAGLAAVWGFVATAIAAINPAIALLGGSFGVIYLGIDGIKRAFGQLIPELGRMKVAASDAFEKGLQPSVENLRAIFPTVERAVKGIATELSGLSNGLTGVLVSANKAGTLAEVFRNIQGAVKDLGPGLNNTFSAMLKVMSLESGFKVLTGTVDAFGAAFNNSVNAMLSDGSLDRGFKSLEAVTRSLARAFVGLTENGIRLFAGAGPGISNFIESLTGFFGRFNWERLGKSVGNVFDGLGKALDKVPDETIEAITKAFEDLGKIFQREDFQQNLANIIGAIPAVIGFIGWLTDAFDNLGSAISAVVDFFSGVWGWLQKVADFFSGKGWSPAYTEPAQSGIGSGMTNLLNSLKELLNGNNNGDQTFTITLDSTEFTTALSDATTNFNNAMEALTTASTNALTAINDGWRVAFDGLVAMTGEKMALVEARYLLGLTNMGTNSGTYLETVRLTFQTVLDLIVAMVGEKMALIEARYLLGLTNMGTNSGTYLETVRLAWQTVLDLIVAMMTEKMALIQFGYLTGLTNMATNTGLYLETVRLAWQTVFQLINTLVLTQMALIQFTYLQGLTNMALNTGLYLETVRLAWQTAFQNIALVVTTGMLQVQLAYTLALTQIAMVTTMSLMQVVMAFQIASTQILAIVTATFAQLPMAVAAGMAGAVAAVVQGGANMLSSVVSTGVSIVSTYTSYWSNAFSIVRDTIGRIVSRVAQGASEIFQANDLSTVINAWRTGWSDIFNIAKEAASKIVNNIKQHLPPGLREAGANAMDALASAIRSGASAVIGAAANVAARAIAAAKNALGIRSPSRVFLAIGAFIMAGWARGMDQNAKQVLKSVNNIADQAVNAARFIGPELVSAVKYTSNAVQDLFDEAPIDSITGLASSEMNAAVEAEGFGDIGERVAEALSGWYVDIDGDGMAKLVNKSNTRKARRR